MRTVRLRARRPSWRSLLPDLRAGADEHHPLTPGAAGSVPGGALRSSQILGWVDVHWRIAVPGNADDAVRVAVQNAFRSTITGQRPQFLEHAPTEDDGRRQ